MLSENARRRYPVVLTEPTLASVACEASLKRPHSPGMPMDRAAVVTSVSEREAAFDAACVWIKIVMAMC